TADGSAAAPAASLGDERHGCATPAIAERRPDEGRRDQSRAWTSAGGAPRSSLPPGMTACPMGVFNASVAYGSFFSSRKKNGSCFGSIGSMSDGKRRTRRELPIIFTTRLGRFVRVRK